MKILVAIFLFFSLLITSLSSFSEEDSKDKRVMLPDYYPMKLDRKAVIQAINVRKGIVEINSGHYLLDSNMPVHNLKTEHSSLHRLTAGDVIGYSQHQIGNNVYISEIWVLPKEMAPPPD